MSATTDSRRSMTENILYISVINAFFWSLALIVSLTHLPGTACFERLLPGRVAFGEHGGQCAERWPLQLEHRALRPHRPVLP